jgi:hypothetical protein
LPFAPWQALHTAAFAAPFCALPAGKAGLPAKAHELTAAKTQNRLMTLVTPIFP